MWPPTTDDRIASALERLVDTFCPGPEPDLSDQWLVFIQTQELNGALSYTYNFVVAGSCADEALEKALSMLHLTNDDRPYRSWAVRTDYVTEAYGAEPTADWHKPLVDRRGPLAG